MTQQQAMSLLEACKKTIARSTTHADLDHAFKDCQASILMAQQHLPKDQIQRERILIQQQFKERLAFVLDASFYKGDPYRKGMAKKRV